MQVVDTTDRAAVGELITMKEYVDVIVPRGGKGLIERISNEARIPVIKHLDGSLPCLHRRRGRLDKAIRIADNAKTHRYGVCNAMETLLVRKNVAAAGAAAAVQDLSGQGRGAARRRCRTRACPADEGGHRGRLAHRISRADP